METSYDWDGLMRRMLDKPSFRVAFDEICGAETHTVEGFRPFFDYVGGYIGEACVKEACAVLSDVLKAIEAGTDTPEVIIGLTSVLKTVAAEHLWQGILIGTLMAESRPRDSTVFE